MISIFANQSHGNKVESVVKVHSGSSQNQYRVGVRWKIRAKPASHTDHSFHY